jgi:hypothetical protein
MILVWTNHPCLRAGTSHPATNRSLPNSQHNPYNHWGLQYRLRHQATALRLQQRSKSHSCRRPHYPDQVVSHSYNLLCPRCKPSFVPPQRCYGTNRPHQSMGCFKNPVDNSSQAEILFLSTFKKCAMTRSSSKNQ